jgi:hypothetical protein
VKNGYVLSSLDLLLHQYREERERERERERDGSPLFSSKKKTLGKKKKRKDGKCV